MPRSATEESDAKAVDQVAGVGDVRSQALRSVGIETVDDVRDASVDELSSAEGVGETTAQQLKDEVETESEDDSPWNGIDTVTIVAGNDFEDVPHKTAMKRIEEAVQVAPYNPRTLVLPGASDVERGINVPNGTPEVLDWRKHRVDQTGDAMALERVVGDFPSNDLWEKNQSAWRSSFGEAISERNEAIGKQCDAVIVVEDGEYLDNTLGDMEAVGCEVFRHIKPEPSDNLDWASLDHEGARTNVAIVDGPDRYDFSDGMFGYSEADMVGEIDDALDAVDADAGVIGRYNRMDDDAPVRAAEAWMESQDERLAERVFHAPWDMFPDGKKGEAASLRDDAMLDWADVVVVVRNGDYTEQFLAKASKARNEVVHVDVHELNVNPRPDRVDEDDDGGPSKTERTANNDPTYKDVADDETEEQRLNHEGPMDTVEDRDDEGVQDFDDGAGGGAGSAGVFRSGQ